MSKEADVIIKDPLYKQILLASRHKKHLDSPEFQRLRHIKQTSFVDLVYPSANHTRFSHSIGAYHLMKKVLDNNLMKISEKDKEALLLSALFHDIGHGPYSHVWEKVFPHFDHEKTTIEILKRKGMGEVVKIIEKQHPYSQLISSTIDVDKLDYMARDSYFAGVSYGVAEVDFIIQHMYVKDKKMIIRPSSLSSVEDLITQRINLFKTVYFHKIAAEYDFIFQKIFQRVDEIRKKEELFIDPHLLAFFEKIDDIDDLLALDDNVINYHIYTWAKSKDKILKDLCKRFIYRKKFKVINLAHKKVDVKKIKENTRKEYDADYYFRHLKYSKPILQTQIYVEFDDGIKKLEDVSELIKFYSKKKLEVEYVIFPKGV